MVNPNRARTWCFTINNYTNDTIAKLCELDGIVKYMIYGKEVGECGTPHLQGLIAFKNATTLQACKTKLGGNAHLTITRNIPKSIEYCKKDGDWIEFGEAPKQGKRDDLEDFLKAIKEDPKRALTDVDFRFEHASVFARYKNFAEDMIARVQPDKQVECFPLKPWQQELNAILILQAHKRQIIFVVDTTGNTGKTWFCHYFKSLHKHVDILVPSKKADMAHKLMPHPRVVFFDAPRSKQGEFIQYDFLEEVKNGYVFSPKYDSKVKSFETPHVVIMMNEHPDMTKLSQDRYKLIII